MKCNSIISYSYISKMSIYCIKQNCLVYSLAYGDWPVLDIEHSSLMQTM